jgi:hypothetical protein
MRTTISYILVFALGLIAPAANGQDMLSGRVYEGQTGVEPPPLGNAKAMEGVTVNLYGAADVRLMGTYITHTTSGSDGWYGLSFSTRVHAYDFYNIVAMTPAGYTSIGATSVSGTVRATDWIQYGFYDLTETTTGNKFWFLSETVPMENQAPKVFAGNDQVMILPPPLPYPVPLAGAVSDDGLPEGEPLVIEWSMVSGPGEVVFEDAANPETTAHFYAYGTYVLRLTAFDGEFEASDEVTIEIQASAPELVCPDELIGVDINGSQPAGGVEPVAVCWRITAGGADISGTADQFYYAYAPDAAHGDFSTVVGWKGGVSRLTAHEWAKAGIMARQNLEPESPHVMVVGTPGNGVALQGRDWPGGESWHVPVGLADWRVDETDTVWLRLDRVGNTVTGSYCRWPGGEHPGTPRVWTASASHEVEMPPNLLIGLATTSHEQGVPITVSYTDLCIGSYLDPPMLEIHLDPEHVYNRDIGTTGGSAIYNPDADMWTVSGSGVDIWGTSDQFHYVYQPTSGDWQMTVTVRSLEDTHEWAKAGLMYRRKLTTDSAYGMIVVTPDRGVAFQWRQEDGEESHIVHGEPAAHLKAPVSLRLVRRGKSLTLAGYYYSDGRWLEQAVAIPCPCIIEGGYIGLAVTSHAEGALTTATFDNELVMGQPVPIPIP